MGKKYIKCPRCELNYIVEGEDEYCHVCKSEMKHHVESDDDELLDLEDMELCPVCGQNYIKEDQTMCAECRGRSKGDSSDSLSDSDEKDWKSNDDSDDDSIISASSDIDREDDDYNSGFSDIDPDSDDIDPYKTEDDLLEVGDGIEFAMDEEELEDDIVVESADDFETVDVSDDDDDDDDDEDDDDYDFEDDLLGKK